MNQRSIDEGVRAAAISIAQQVSDGLLDPYPQDKQAAINRLQTYIDLGDITEEELMGFPNLR
jgi:hypothetical protein